MIELSGFSATQEVTVLDSEIVEKTVKSAFETIKKGLPEEAHTVEVMEFIIEEMQTFIKTRKISL